jgi:hypothetical protein
MYLSLLMPNDASVYCAGYGLRVINNIEIEIGGQKIDKHYSHWLYIWNELSLPKSKRLGYNKMVGMSGSGVPGSGSDTATEQAAKGIGDLIRGRTLYIPLEFWFCRNVGLALPLIALQYHEVKINIQFETGANCAGSASNVPSTFPTATLWVDYIFLDTDERRRFAQLSHEYLIEQLQFTGSESMSTGGIKAKLTFNHPCKEIVWFINKKVSNTQSVINNNWFNYTSATSALIALPYTYNYGTQSLREGSSTSAGGVPNGTVASLNNTRTAKLTLNGNDRFSERPGSYFNLIQPFQHHENIPTNAGINVYSFALKPEEHQPSGTLNMSRIDTATLAIDSGIQSGDNAFLNVYAVNYNVLRILSGMGGLAYSN